MLTSLKGHLFIRLIKVEIAQRGVKNDKYRASGREGGGRLSVWTIRKAVWGSHGSRQGPLTVNQFVPLLPRRIDGR